MQKYRKGVVICVYDPLKKLILVGERSDIKNAWQLPQGGIDKNETPEKAAKRELMEEMGLRIELPIKKGPYKYDYPNQNLKYKGQEQFWFMGYANCDIKVKMNHEFQNYGWKSLNFVLGNIVNFKKTPYERAFKSLFL